MRSGDKTGPGDKTRGSVVLVQPWGRSSVIYFLVLFLLCRHYVVKGPEETPYFGETEAKLASHLVCL